MSRNIPAVRTWKVRYWRDDAFVLADIRVQTINKRFARWLARDLLLAMPSGPGIYSHATRVTVSLHRWPNMCGRRR